MASRQLVSRQKVPFLCCLEPCFKPMEKLKPPQMLLQANVSRRIGLIATVGSALLAREVIMRPEIGYGLELEMEMEQTIEESMNRIRGYADSLSDIKAFLERESWKEAQKVLRKSSSNLKLDVYTIIQSKPGKERPQLRQLYFNLFNNVTKLDYAARDKDASRVWQCYGNIVTAYNDLLSRL